MTRIPPLSDRTDWADLPRIIATGFVVGAGFSLAIVAFG
jgi:hypothetical protein